MCEAKNLSGGREGLCEEFPTILTKVVARKSHKKDWSSVCTSGTNWWTSGSSSWQDLTTVPPPGNLSTSSVLEKSTVATCGHFNWL